jgi:hypothetical protein
MGVRSSNTRGISIRSPQMTCDFADQIQRPRLARNTKPSLIKAELGGDLANADEGIVL